MLNRNDKSMDGQLCYVAELGGRRFEIYYKYCEIHGRCYPDMPNFEEYPVYTGEGEPFVTAVQEACEYGVCDKNREFTGECSDCKYLKRNDEHDLIGICTCANKNINKTEEEKRCGQ